MKKIRMKIVVSGAHLGDPNGSQIGDILEVEDGVAEAYVLHHLADLVKEEKKVVPPKVETATAPVVEVETAKLPEPEPEPPEKRGPGRPRKA